MKGVPADLVVGNDFMIIRAALVETLGSANDALVWTRIHWRCEIESPRTFVDEQGIRWWPASRAEIGDETGLTIDQVRRSLDRLISGDFIEAVEHRRGGNYDRTRSLRPLVRGVDPQVADLPHRGGKDARSQVADLPTVLSIRDLETKPLNVGEAAVAVSGPWMSLCLMLADRIEANGSRRPTISTKWLNAARLMVERDGRTVEQITAMIVWSQTNEFWRANVMSMPKLREKYDQMRLQALRETTSGTAGVVAAGRALYEQYRQQETAGMTKEREQIWSAVRS